MILLVIALAAVCWLLVCCAGLYRFAEWMRQPATVWSAVTEPLPVLARVEAYSDEAWDSQITTPRRYVLGSNDQYRDNPPSR